MAKKILIVDDLAFVRKGIAHILQGARYEIAGEASDGEQAIQLFRSLKPDAIIMDIVMPRLGGIEACRQILKEDPTALVLMVTGMSHEQMVIDAFHAGARDFIQKPFHPQELLRAIDHLLSADDKINSKVARFETGKERKERQQRARKLQDF